MPPLVMPLLAVVLGLLNVTQFVLGLVYRRKDDVMKYSDHWRSQAESLYDETDRLRRRIEDTEKHCAAETAALKIENQALSDRLLVFMKLPPQPQPGVQP